MSYTYPTWVAALAELAVVQSTDADFQGILPSTIDYAEQRIYRDLNLLATTVRDSSAKLTANSRNFTLPTTLGRFVTVEDVNVITPSTAVVASGTRTQLNSASLQLLDFLYPTETAPTTPSVPSLFAMVTDQIIAVGPAPDATYTVEVVGTIRPTPLSAINTTTYLSLYLPDLFMAASMVFITGYQQNFGAQTDNPQMAQSWETQYGKLLASASAEEIRKKYNETFPAMVQHGPTSGGAV